ncbi:MAG: GNAT family N-acetyltransferase [Chloroflexi bacterium]|nr:GNAT family N-acetyltransferase [Chloroflexota bacterium]MBI5704693.1 GNAT family N-acetyltransferase [Chloroflexota bacterium]
MPELTIKLLETPEEMTLVEELQRLVWPGSETDVVPAHVFITAVHNGGLVLGAFQNDELVGFVFGFPGLDFTPDGPRPKHCSHMMGVKPGARDSGIGFALKRAQWQMVRKQGVDHITWTYDPLLSRNARLNIAKLGAVCNTYRRAEYGEMRDGLNAGLPSDRFQVDWWVNTRRVERRLSKRPRRPLKLEDFSKADLHPLYTPLFGTRSLPRPPEHFAPLEGRLLLAEIPSDFLALKEADFALARDWRFFSREVFETAFAAGYLVTDFIHDQGRSFYVLTDGESTLE